MKLFDLVAETRDKLRPFLAMETFKTGTIPATHLAVDIILQEAFERAAAPSLHREGAGGDQQKLWRIEQAVKLQSDPAQLQQFYDYVKGVVEGRAEQEEKP